MVNFLAHVALWKEIKLMITLNKDTHWSPAGKEKADKTEGKTDQSRQTKTDVFCEQFDLLFVSDVLPLLYK